MFDINFEEIDIYYEKLLCFNYLEDMFEIEEGCYFEIPTFEDMFEDM
jgi:hypothetical protein